MAIRVLGPLETGSEHCLEPAGAVVLAALIVRAGRAVTPGELAEAYWGENSPRTWPQQVKTSVARIRADWAAAPCSPAARTTRWASTRPRSTRSSSSGSSRRARQHALHGEHDRAIDAYRRALALWRGQAYIELWPIGSPESWRPSDWPRSATAPKRSCSRRGSDIGEHREIIADAERLVREAPLREERWAILAMANYRAGRQVEALAAIRASAGALSRRARHRVGARLRELETAMLRQDPTARSPSPMHRVERSVPVSRARALRPRRSRRLLRSGCRTSRRSSTACVPGAILTIVGASGSGKSSLVLAGVLPRDRREWAARRDRDAAAGCRARRLRQRIANEERAEIVVDRPGGGDLPAAAPESTTFCALCSRKFCNVGARVVLTLAVGLPRSRDGLPHIGAEVGRGVYALGPLSVGGAAEAIEGPLGGADCGSNRGSWSSSSGMPRDRQTTLPHVSHALLETWVRREGATLTVAGYEASGGIAGAIAQSAETCTVPAATPTPSVAR